MRIEIDTDRCIGAARCVQHAPGVFTQDDDGVVELLPVSGEPADAPLIQEAVIACPVQAITVEQP
ncbi:ferredoxin [Streptomyces anulatus]|uniref:ferredoxin n=1 Tax=Streptomyces anulatus TaxID=1892 RepID=UPI00342DB015